MVQKLRTHRRAFDFDQKFCEAHVKEAIIQAKKQGGLCASGRHLQQAERNRSDVTVSSCIT
jgi:hypothetical protein